MKGAKWRYKGDLHKVVAGSA